VNRVDGSGRWVLIVAGIVIQWVAIGTIISGLVRYAAPGSQGASMAVTVVSGCALFGFGLSLDMIAFPAFSAIVGLLLVPPSLLAALALAIAGGVLAQTDPEGFDGARAAAGARIGALLLVALAVCLMVNLRLWLRRRGARPAAHHALHIASTAYGSLLFCLALLFAVLTAINLVRAHLDGAGSASLDRAVLLIGYTVILGGSGALLFWHGAAGLTDVPPSRFRPPPIWAPLLAATAAVGLGELALRSGSAVALMPFAHAAIVVMPGLAIIALASSPGRRLPDAARSTWREIGLMVAYGAAVAATIAGIVNTLALAGSVVVFLTAQGAFDGVSTSQEFLDVLSYPADYIGQSAQIGLLLVVIAVLGPLNEEFWKGFGVRLLRSHRATRYQSFFWGLASGVGFGAVEANDYGFAAFHQSPYRWWDTVVLRGGASTLHALASGTVGIGWYYLFAGRRLRGLGLFILAVGLHGSWNGLSVLTAARVLPWFKSLPDHDLEIVLELSTLMLAVPIVCMVRLLSRSLAAEDGAEPPGQTPSPASVAELTSCMGAAQSPATGV